MLKLLHAPKVMHKIRLTNSGEQPLTTAPALLLREGKVLSQGMMTYTSRGGTVDLTLTTAVDGKVNKNDQESKRTPNAAVFEKESFWRIDIDSSLALTNYRPQPVEADVTRCVLGSVDSAAPGATTQ